MELAPVFKKAKQKGLKLALHLAEVGQYHLLQFD